MNDAPNQNGKVLEETPVGSNSDAAKKHRELYVISKRPSLFRKFSKNLSPFLCYFVTYNRESYE